MKANGTPASGGPKRRVWRKIHLGIDEETPEVRAVETGSHIGDAPVLPDPLNQIPAHEQIGRVTADGAYDSRKCHDDFAGRGADGVIPPRKNAQPWKTVTAGAMARNEALRAEDRGSSARSPENQGPERKRRRFGCCRRDDPRLFQAGRLVRVRLTYGEQSAEFRAVENRHERETLLLKLEGLGIDRQSLEGRRALNTLADLQRQREEAQKDVRQEWLHDQQDEIAGNQRELALIGTSNAERIRANAIAEAEIEIRKSKLGVTDGLGAVLGWALEAGQHSIQQGAITSVALVAAVGAAVRGG